jgi:3D (Asp-Asp-Asp) domain-containing protein
MDSVGLRTAAVAATVVALVSVAATARSGHAAAAASCPPRPPDTARRITHSRWLSNAVVTEYYPVREQWFDGAKARVPGLATSHKLDWLYGPHGVAMNGEGLGANGRYYHFAGPYNIGWVNADGQPTSGCWNGVWTNGEPAWLDVGWRNAHGQVTYRLADGAWTDGRGVRQVPLRARFAAGLSRSIPFWHTVAVDPHVVPLGSRVFIPAYCDTPADGWFKALDTGGAIIGYHFDVYRAPPKTLVLHAYRDQKVYVVPPGARVSASGGARCR